MYEYLLACLYSYMSTPHPVPGSRLGVTSRLLLAYMLVRLIPASLLRLYTDAVCLGSMLRLWLLRLPIRHSAQFRAQSGEASFRVLGSMPFAVSQPGLLGGKERRLTTRSNIHTSIMRQDHHHGSSGEPHLDALWSLVLAPRHLSSYQTHNRSVVNRLACFNELLNTRYFF